MALPRLVEAVGHGCRFFRLARRVGRGVVLVASAETLGVLLPVGRSGLAFVFQLHRRWAAKPIILRNGSASDSSPQACAGSSYRRSLVLPRLRWRVATRSYRRIAGHRRKAAPPATALSWARPGGFALPSYTITRDTTPARRRPKSKKTIGGRDTAPPRRQKPGLRSGSRGLRATSKVRLEPGRTSQNGLTFLAGTEARPEHWVFRH